MTAANADLERIGAIVRESSSLREIYRNTAPEDIPARLRRSARGRELLTQIDAHLDAYGFRELSIITVGLPPLKDVPWVVHGTLTALARREERGEPSANDRLERARSLVASQHGLRARLLRRPLARLYTSARAATALREDSYYLIVTVIAVVRRMILELGRRLAERGVLRNPDDIVYLELDEWDATSADRLRSLVERRKAARGSALDHYTAVPAELLERAGGSEHVQGTPASRGTFVGLVRVVNDESEFAALADGEVLVCPYTNPTWTPLFAVAGAVVVDSGGMASHAAIVAREHGIPAIMGTRNGTRVLTTGQRVLVDADRGVVVPIG